MSLTLKQVDYSEKSESITPLFHSSSKIYQIYC